MQAILGDLTRPIPVDKRLVQRPTNRLALGLIAVLIVRALGRCGVRVAGASHGCGKVTSSKCARPSWQRSTRPTIRFRPRTIACTPAEGIKEAARDEINYVEAGEQRITVITVAAPSQMLPAGWPYDQVTQIIALRRAEARCVGGGAGANPVVT